MRTARITLATLALTLGASAEEPFVDLAFEDALARAAQEEKIVMVDFFTTWCAPCKKLDHVTWKDERVRAWLSEKTVALKIDAEKEVELAQRYGVRAYPTLLFTKADGTELERIVGFKGPDDFLADAAFVAAGRKLIDREREQLAGKENDPMARSELGRSCLRVGLHDEALEHLLWCWDHGNENDPAYNGVRVSFLLGDLARLAKEYPPALEALRERRAASAKELLHGDPGQARAADLAVNVMSLDRALGESERTLQLQDEIAARPEVAPEVLRAVRMVFFDQVADLLLDARRYDDVLAGLGGDIDAYVDRQVDFLRTLAALDLDEPEEETSSMTSFRKGRMVDAAGRAYAVQLGLGEVELAADLADRIIAIDPVRSTYETLVERAAEHAGPQAASVLDALLVRAASDLDEKDLGRLERKVARAKRKLPAADAK